MTMRMVPSSNRETNMEARTLLKTVEDAEFCELSFEEIDAVSGGDCSLPTLMEWVNNATTVGNGRLFDAWVRGGCK
jgi:hypothetical protein